KTSSVSVETSAGSSMRIGSSRMTSGGLRPDTGGGGGGAPAVSGAPASAGAACARAVAAPAAATQQAQSTSHARLRAQASTATRKPMPGRSIRRRRALGGLLAVIVGASACTVEQGTITIDTVELASGEYYGLKWGGTQVERFHVLARRDSPIGDVVVVSPNRD